VNTLTRRLFGSGSRNVPTVAAVIALLTAAPVTTMAVDPGSDSVLQQLAAKISLSDLDLTTERGLQLASERVHHTAVRLCNRLRDMQDLGHHEAFVRCVDQAVASASADLSALAHRDAGLPVASIPASR
jgi:UrcA family protein